MPQAFNNAISNNVTSVTTVYTAPGSTTSVVIGLIVANETSSDTTVTISMTKGGTTISLLNSGPLPGNSNLAVLTNNSRLVLLAGNSIAVTAGQNVDVAVSVLEIT